MQDSSNALIPAQPSVTLYRPTKVCTEKSRILAERSDAMNIIETPEADEEETVRDVYKL